MTKTARETGEEGIARKLYLSLNATDEKVSRFLNDFFDVGYLWKPS